MNVKIGEQEYAVHWRNVPELRVHDPGWQVIYVGRQARIVPPLTIQQFLDSGLDFRRYLKLRQPRHISLITTTCRILDDEGEILSTGFAFYSRSEVQSAVPFSRVKAKFLSLQRALGILKRETPESLSVRYGQGHVWSTNHQRLFLDAFGELNRPRKRKNVKRVG